MKLLNFSNQMRSRIYTQKEKDYRRIQSLRSDDNLCLSARGKTSFVQRTFFSVHRISFVPRILFFPFVLNYFFVPVFFIPRFYLFLKWKWKKIFKQWTLGSKKNSVNNVFQKFVFVHQFFHKCLYQCSNNLIFLFFLMLLFISVVASFQ